MVNREKIQGESCWTKTEQIAFLTLRFKASETFSTLGDYKAPIKLSIILFIRNIAKLILHFLSTKSSHYVPTIKFISHPWTSEVLNADTL